MQLSRRDLFLDVSSGFCTLLVLQQGSRFEKRKHPCAETRILRVDYEYIYRVMFRQKCPQGPSARANKGGALFILSVPWESRSSSINNERTHRRIVACPFPSASSRRKPVSSQGYLRISSNSLVNQVSSIRSWTKLTCRVLHQCAGAPIGACAHTLVFMSS